MSTYLSTVGCRMLINMNSVTSITCCGGGDAVSSDDSVSSHDTVHGLHAVTSSGQTLLLLHHDDIDRLIRFHGCSDRQRFYRVMISNHLRLDCILRTVMVRIREQLIDGGPLIDMSETVMKVLEYLFEFHETRSKRNKKEQRHDAQ